ncbi:hypothetical protein N9234_03660, partial [Akkermansiaceae bacterium]|nr:hypothetical protein [Akkermansiaceae bacterium]
WGRSSAYRMERERVTGFLRKEFGGLRDIGIRKLRLLIGGIEIFREPSRKLTSHRVEFCF